MKAIAVKPGVPNTVHLTELPAPKVTDIPNGCGVLVRVLRVLHVVLPRGVVHGGDVGV